MVTEAQQKLEVASLDAKAAQQEKSANIARGEGEAARRRLVFQADNALEKKGEFWLEAQKVWAEAISKYQGAWVPQIVTGNSGSAAVSGSGMVQIMELIGAKMANDLRLDLKQTKP